GLRPVADAPPRDPPALVARGRALFTSDRVGCTGCHLGDGSSTDGERHQVLDNEKAIDTPALSHLGNTAPYFHDGTAQTLEDVVSQAGDRMGHTRLLSGVDRVALAAYLRTL